VRDKNICYIVGADDAVNKPVVTFNQLDGYDGSSELKFEMQNEVKFLVINYRLNLKKDEFSHSQH